MQVLKEVFEQVDGQQESDIYGNGQIIESFQEKMATYLGKESAVFFPSGYNGSTNSLTNLVRTKKGLRK